MEFNRNVIIKIFKKNSLKYLYKDKKLFYSTDKESLIISIKTHNEIFKEIIKFSKNDLGNAIIENSDSGKSNEYMITINKNSDKITIDPVDITFLKLFWFSCCTDIKCPKNEWKKEGGPYNKFETIHEKILDDPKKYISNNAIKVITRLSSYGYNSYLVGGCIRDILLNLKPKDFDIITDAKPEEIHKLFVNSKIVGTRFPIVQVFFPTEIIEITTFRSTNDTFYDDIYEDATRRDFTINSLYYNIFNNTIIDPFGGQKDISNKVIRTIGDSDIRYKEDPIRILRAIRLAVKISFKIDNELSDAIFKYKHLLLEVNNTRLFQEFIKSFFNESIYITFLMFSHFGILDVLFKKSIKDNILAEASVLKIQSYGTSKFLYFNNPIFIIAVFLYEPSFLTKDEEYIKNIINEESNIIFLNNTYKTIIKDIYILQKDIFNFNTDIINNINFRYAYEFAILRSDFDITLVEPINKWTKFINNIKEITLKKRKEEIKNIEEKIKIEGPKKIKEFI